MTRATVTKVDGQLVLDDPDAVAVITAVEAHNRTISKGNCRKLFDLNFDRVTHFLERVNQRGLTPEDVVIVLIEVDDPNGGALAEILMPGTDWQPFRDRGEMPVARGLAGREGIQECLDHLDDQAAEILRKMTDVAVVVVAFGTADVFEAK